MRIFQWTYGVGCYKRKGTHITYTSHIAISCDRRFSILSNWPINPFRLKNKTFCRWKYLIWSHFIIIFVYSKWINFSDYLQWSSTRNLHKIYTNWIQCMNYEAWAIEHENGENNEFHTDTIRHLQFTMMMNKLVSMRIKQCC